MVAGKEKVPGIDCRQGNYDHLAILLSLILPVLLRVQPLLLLLHSLLLLLPLLLLILILLVILILQGSPTNVVVCVDCWASSH